MILKNKIKTCPCAQFMPTQPKKSHTFSKPEKSMSREKTISYCMAGFKKIHNYIKLPTQALQKSNGRLLTRRNMFFCHGVTQLFEKLRVFLEVFALSQ